MVIRFDNAGIDLKTFEYNIYRNEQRLEGIIVDDSDRTSYFQANPGDKIEIVGVSKAFEEPLKTLTMPFRWLSVMLSGGDHKFAAYPLIVKMEFVVKDPDEAVIRIEDGPTGGRVLRCEGQDGFFYDIKWDQERNQTWVLASILPVQIAVILVAVLFIGVFSISDGAGKGISIFMIVLLLLADALFAYNQMKAKKEYEV